MSHRPAVSGSFRRPHRFAAVPLLAKMLLIPALLALVAAPARAAYAELEMIRGRAIIIREGREISVRPGERIAIEFGDEVRTLSKSKAHLDILGEEEGGRAGEGEAIISANTTIRVRDLVRKRGIRSFLSLIFGGIRLRVAQWRSPRQALVTSVATIGIKGTDFIILVKRAQATEFIGITGTIEGVSLTNANHRLTIGKRQWGEIIKGVKPNPPIRVPDSIWIPALQTFSFLQ